MKKVSIHAECTTFPLIPSLPHADDQSSVFGTENEDYRRGIYLSHGVCIGWFKGSIDSQMKPMRKDVRNLFFFLPFIHSFITPTYLSLSPTSVKRYHS
jgi:hypothetical protein